MSFLKKYAPSFEDITVVEDITTGEAEFSAARDRAEVEATTDFIEDTTVARDALVDVREQLVEVDRSSTGEVAAETLQALNLSVRNALRIVYGRELPYTASVESHYSIESLLNSINAHIVTLESISLKAMAGQVEKQSNLLQKLGRSIADFFRRSRDIKSEINNVSEDKYDEIVSKISKNILGDIQHVASDDGYANIMNPKAFVNMMDAAEKFVQYFDTVMRKIDEGFIKKRDVEEVEPEIDYLLGAIDKYYNIPVGGLFYNSGKIGIVIVDGKYTRAADFIHREDTPIDRPPTLKELIALVNEMDTARSEFTDIVKRTTELKKVSDRYVKFIEMNINNARNYPELADKINYAATTIYFMIFAADWIASMELERIQKVDNFATDVIRINEKLS